MKTNNWLPPQLPSQPSEYSQKDFLIVSILNETIQTISSNLIKISLAIFVWYWKEQIFIFMYIDGKW